LAVKELQKINSFKSPREKLSCIMSCCQVINNLLLNVSMSNDRTLSGADDFLPILIYITIKVSLLLFLFILSLIFLIQIDMITC
ncbi:Os03g0842700, partial [Oryza sativa Japonica Group]